MGHISEVAPGRRLLERCFRALCRGFMLVAPGLSLRVGLLGRSQCAKVYKPDEDGAKQPEFAANSQGLPFQGGRSVEVRVNV